MREFNILNPKNLYLKEGKGSNGNIIPIVASTDISRITSEFI